MKLHTLSNKEFSTLRSYNTFSILSKKDRVRLYGSTNYRRSCLTVMSYKEYVKSRNRYIAKNMNQINKEDAKKGN